MRDGWTEARLGEIVEKIGMGPFGSNIKVSTFVSEGVPVISGAHLVGTTLKEDWFNYLTPEHADRLMGSNVRRGDLVLTHAGTVGQVSLIPGNSRFERYVVSQRGFYIRPNQAITVPEYLLLYLRYGEGHTQLMSNINRTGVPSLSQPVTFTKQMRVDVPPLEAQKRIVDVVSSVDAFIDALQQQADTARTARNAVLHELLSAGGDDWTETTLGELCELYQPETISKAKMDDAAPYIVYGANGPVGRYSRFNHEEPEVVVTCRGATCGVVNMTPPNCWITGNAMVVKPRDNRSIKGFLFWALQTSVDVQATISGSAQPQITRAGLEPSKILVPPLVEQKRIVEIVTSMDDVIHSTEQAVADAKNLRSGLLSDLLSGDHEIPESYYVFVGAA